MFSDVLYLFCTILIWWLFCLLLVKFRELKSVSRNDYTVNSTLLWITALDCVGKSSIYPHKLIFTQIMVRCLSRTL